MKNLGSSLDYKVTIRLNQLEFNFINNMAKKNNISLSDALRIALDSFIPENLLTGGEDAYIKTN